MVKPALRMLLVENAEKTWRKLTFAVIDQVFQVRYCLEQAHNGSPCHVLLRRLFNDRFVINYIMAGSTHWVPVDHYLIETTRSPPTILTVRITVRLFAIEPYIPFDTDALDVPSRVRARECLNKFVYIAPQSFTMVDCDIDLPKDEK
jgi:hypothetical protein